MITVTQLSVQKGARYALWTSTVTQNSLVNDKRVVYFLDGVRATGSNIRLPGDFLHQGPAFDKYGNRSVENLQRSGGVSVIPKVNGSAVLTDFMTQYVERQTAHYSGPPGANVGGTAAVLNYGPIRCSGILRRDRHSTTRVACETIFALGNGRQAGIAYCSCGIQTRKNEIWASAVVRTPSGTISISSSECITYALPCLEGWPKDWADLTDNLEKWRAGVERAVDLLVDLISIKYYESHDSREWTRRTFTGTWDPGEFPSPKTIEKVLTVSPSQVMRESLTPDQLSLHAGEVIEKYNAFDSNLIAYGADLKKTGDTLRSVLKLGANIRSPKAWASAWLSGRYGDRLFVDDTKTLLKSLRTELTTRSSCVLARSRYVDTRVLAGGVPMTISRTSTLVAYNESYTGLMTLINNLMRWDVWPTLENTWDLIPLSFVVDWFLPVQDVLNQIDHAVQAPYIRAKSGYVGEKKEASEVLLPNTYYLSGTVRTTYYHRFEHNCCQDVRPFSVQTSLPTFSVVNAVDASALLVTTCRRH